MDPTPSAPAALSSAERGPFPSRRLIASRMHVVLNTSAGGAEGQGLRDRTVAGLLTAGAVGVTIDTDQDRPLDERARAAAAGDADVVVAAGGDGTATVLAAALLCSDKALALLPLGTANLLDRDLGIPPGLYDAITALAA